MKKYYKYFIISFIFAIFCSQNSFSKPRCEIFYEEVYNQVLYPRDVDYLPVGTNSIGFELKQELTEDNRDWRVKKNQDDYFMVGLINRLEFATLDENDFEKIRTNDVILSINNIDIRKTYDVKEYGQYISDAYELNESLNIKFLRNISNGKQEVFSINTKNISISYNDPLLDIFVNNISPNEKDGSYEVALTTDFSAVTTEEYNLTKYAHKNLVKGNNSDNYPSEKQIADGEYIYEECSIGENRWTATNSIDPNYGVKFRNIISEDKNKRYARYLIIPSFEEKYLGKKNVMSAQVRFIKDTSYIIENNFNLKSFPFDKQILKLEIGNVRFNLETWLAHVSPWTLIKSSEFVNENSIPGWNIRKFNIEHKQFYDGLYDDFSSGIEMSFEIERKSGYYIFKIILPIVLILMVCWSVVWIDPKELESRLTITIVCLLSLIAYNFVIDKDLPKLEYLTVLDWFILISYVYATIPNFLSIISFQNINKKNKLSSNLDYAGKKYGALSYILIVLLIIITNANLNPDFTSSALGWLTYVQS
tara:strand:+ start:1670 stop:3271 length:1602 start_codon:yes stop_codon:yes gene_type:complete